MKKITDILKKVNKYWLAVIVFAILTFVVGDSTLRDRISYNQEISRLKKEIAHYSELKATNQQRLKSLQDDDENLETFAREEYRMVKPNEDLYIVKE